MLGAVLKKKGALTTWLCIEVINMHTFTNWHINLPSFQSVPRHYEVIMIIIDESVHLSTTKPLSFSLPPLLPSLAPPLISLSAHHFPKRPRRRAIVADFIHVMRHNCDNGSMNGFYGESAGFVREAQRGCHLCLTIARDAPISRRETWQLRRKWRDDSFVTNRLALLNFIISSAHVLIYYIKS